MNAVTFHYAGPDAELSSRRLLDETVGDQVSRAALDASASAPGAAPWHVTVAPSALVDGAGLALVASALGAYDGPADHLGLVLSVDAVTARDFYSLQQPPPAAAIQTVAGAASDRMAVSLPLVARRARSATGTTEAPSDTAPVHWLEVVLGADILDIPFPRGLAAPDRTSVPHGLLMTCSGPFDLLFANQIAVVSALRRAVTSSPLTWIRALMGAGGPGPLNQRVVHAFRNVHPTAQVHSTAVLEGAIVGPGARIGAHCVVRCSVVGEGARLHDGAKVEYSVVGPRSWLMHDLTLYRCMVEDEVFLIHGPYQFSHFESGSAAFATIMMDYRPDRRAIRAPTAAGPQPYGGPFLGASLGAGAKVLGGCLLAPGRRVPPGTWLGPDPAQIHSVTATTLPSGTALAPDQSRRPSLKEVDDGV